MAVASQSGSITGRDLPERGIARRPPASSLSRASCRLRDRFPGYGGPHHLRIVGGDSLLLPASVDLDYVFGTNWQPLFEPETFGILWLVAGTANVVVGIARVIAVPVGLRAAIYLSEYAAQRPGGSSSRC